MAGVVHTAASSFIHCILGDLQGHDHVSSEAPSLLHGVLGITIYEANHLDNLIDGFLIQTGDSVEKFLHHRLAHTRLFATVDIGEDTVARTRIADFQAASPKWNQSFPRVYCAHSSSSVAISIRKQLDVVLSPVLGRAAILASQLLTGKLVQGWFDIYHEDGRRVHKAKVHVAIKYTPRLPTLPGAPASRPPSVAVGWDFDSLISVRDILYIFV